MKTRIGLIGPGDSVRRIQHVAAGFGDKLELIPGIYSKKEESAQLAADIEREADVLLFSGIIPYKIGTYAGGLQKPCLYIPSIGTSIIRAIWEMRDKNEGYGRVSVDSIERNDLEETAAELGFKFDALEIVEYDETTSYEKLADMHEALFQSGRTEVALTALSDRTRDILVERGVRCYRIFPTRYLIREYIQRALYVAETNKLKAYQISVMILRLRGGKASVVPEYEYLKLRNTFERLLIDYTKGLFGSMFPFGHDEYILFTTRGAMDDGRGLEKLFKAATHTGIDFCAGLGYGQTSFNAEANARKALNRSCALAGSSLFSVDVEGEIIGPISSELQMLRYNISETDVGVQEAARETGLSAAYITKIRSMMIMTKKNRFDVEEFAAGLDVSERSARRILQGIAAAGRADVVALENKSTTGRPRRLYELKL